MEKFSYLHSRKQGGRRLKWWNLIPILPTGCSMTNAKPAQPGCSWAFLNSTICFYFSWKETMKTILEEQEGHLNRIPTISAFGARLHLLVHTACLQFWELGAGGPAPIPLPLVFPRGQVKPEVWKTMSESKCALYTVGLRRNSYQLHNASFLTQV